MDVFGSCDLDLDSTTYIYERDPFYLEISSVQFGKGKVLSQRRNVNSDGADTSSWWRYTGFTNINLRQGFPKLSSVRQKDRETESSEIT